MFFHEFLCSRCSPAKTLYCPSFCTLISSVFFVVSSTGQCVATKQTRTEPNNDFVLWYTLVSLFLLYTYVFWVCKYLTTHFSAKTSRLIIIHFQLKYYIYTCVCIGELFFIKSTTNIADIIIWVPLRNLFRRERLNSQMFFIDLVVYTNNTFKYDYIKF